MYLERHGEGEKIYLGLHGWGADRRVFAPLLPLLPPQAAMYLADLPGISLSPAPREWSIEAVVGEISEALPAIANPRATIVGHCGGAVFGLLAAIKNAASIERIVMIDPFSYLPRYFKIFLQPAIGKRAYNATFANSFGRWVTNQALRGKRQSEADLTEVFRLTNHETSRNYLRLFAEAEKIAIPEIPGVKVDLVYGEKTFGAVKKSVAALKSSLPQARIWKLENAAHLPLEEAPEELCKIIFES